MASGAGYIYLGASSDTSRTSYAIALPYPDLDKAAFETSRMVDSARNANGEVVGRQVGRSVHKQNLAWSKMDKEKWWEMNRWFDDGHFTFYCHYFNHNFGRWETRLFYLGDVKTNPYLVDPVSGEPAYYILPEFGDLPLFAVTSERVGAFYDRISGVLSPSMCSKVSMCLNAIFETAIYNDLCDKNPAKFKKLKSKKRVKRKPVYSDAEILTAERWFLNKMPEVVLLLETGARRGEMAGWRSGDFDLRLRAYDISRQLQRQKGGVIVERAPKNDSFRTNPLSNVAIQAYKRCLEMYGPGPYLVHEHGAALNPEKWSARLKREMERFNRAYPSIPPLTSHQLRHTYGTWLRRHGVDIHSIAKILGHKSIDVTGNTYVHNELATLRRAIRFNAKQPLIIPIREEQTA